MLTTSANAASDGGLTDDTTVATVIVKIFLLVVESSLFSGHALELPVTAICQRKHSLACVHRVCYGVHIRRRCHRVILAATVRPHSSIRSRGIPFECSLLADPGPLEA